MAATPEQFAESTHLLREFISARVLGQAAVIDQVLIALFSRGHCLVQGVPGLAKTLLISTLADACELTFQRVQFTPDLMPSDITGTELLQIDPETGRRQLEFAPGPLFAGLVLADEINRAPPKTQAALLQAMQERQVTIGRQTLALPDPFFVMATQNPIEQEGTYPLPEAQLDRFMFMVKVDYPEASDEIAVLKRMVGGDDDGASAEQKSPVIHLDRLKALQQLVANVLISDHLLEYAVSLIRATRPASARASDFVRQWIDWGAGPRAGGFLVRSAQTRALMAGRMHTILEDFQYSAPAVLRHRLVLNFNASAEGITVDQVIEKLLVIMPSGLATGRTRLL